MDTMTRAYLECAMWTAEDDIGDRGFTDMAPEAVAQAVAECAAFQEAAGGLLANLDNAGAGHDFWLTRNWHGAGFWDRGLGDVGDKLTDVAHRSGGRDLYVGDDGRLYFSPGA